MFSCPGGGDFFEAVLLPQRPQATEAVEKCCFSRISDDDVRQFFGVVLELARSFRSMGFSPGR